MFSCYNVIMHRFLLLYCLDTEHKPFDSVCGKVPNLKCIAIRNSLQSKPSCVLCDTKCLCLCTSSKLNSLTSHLLPFFVDTDASGKPFTNVFGIYKQKLLFSQQKHYRIISYSFSPSSWTCSSSCCVLCHRPTHKRQVPHGDDHRAAVTARRCDTTQGTWWDWSPQSWGCVPRPLGAQPCAALQGCCWGAGSTQSWLLCPYHSSGCGHITSTSHLQ